MSILRSFVTYLEDSGLATLGTDLFIGEAPSSDHVPDAVWWLKSNGGAPTARNPTGEVTKSYLVQVYYRDRSGQQVDEKLFALEEQLNSSANVQLAGFETIEIRAVTFPSDNDLDDEDRKVGLLQVSILTYKD